VQAERRAFTGKKIERLVLVTGTAYTDLTISGAKSARARLLRMAPSLADHKTLGHSPTIC
jgi:hypothetical protein